MSYSCNKSIDLSTVPGQVQHLTVTNSSFLPSLTLNWEAPANALVAGDVLHYCIKITPTSSDDIANEDLPKEVVVEGDTTMLELSNMDGLQPLHGYMFEVRAKSCKQVTGDWSKVNGCLGKSVIWR